MWEIYRQDMISYSGISIFLLGNKKEGETTVLSNGMRSEYEISKKQGNFLIPIGRTGYISEVLWNELLKENKMIIRLIFIDMILYLWVIILKR